MLLKDKVVIVSGIGPGLGQELAYGAAREGAKIAIAARSTELLNKLKEEIGEKSDVIAIPCDITDKKDCENLVNETIKKFGKLDGLINSAYRAGDFKEIEDSDFDDWHETMNTNFFGTMNLTMAAVKEMVPNKKGAIVMINSLITKKTFTNSRRLCCIKRRSINSNKNSCKRVGPKRNKSQFSIHGLDVGSSS